MNSAVLRLLRPLCRLLLRHNVPFAAFEELAKQVYVEVALDDFGLPGRKSTISRASILTGLTRKDVQRIVSRADPGLSQPDDGYNRAARVLTGWARDPDFCAADGTPRPLAAQEGDLAFPALVRRYSGDMPVRAVLDELLRVGAVRRLGDQRLELVTRAYVPQTGETEKLGILGTDVAALIGTIDHNLLLGQDDPRFQRKVMYRNYPSALVPAFRKLSAAQSQALLEKLDRWLAEQAQAAPVSGSGSPSDATQAPAALVRLGVGIYYFEEPMVPGDTKEQQDGNS